MLRIYGEDAGYAFFLGESADIDSAKGLVKEYESRPDWPAETVVTIYDEQLRCWSNPRHHDRLGADGWVGPDDATEELEAEYPTLEAYLEDKNG